MGHAYVIQQYVMHNALNLLQMLGAQYAMADTIMIVHQSNV